MESIYIDRVIRGKNPRLARHIPKCLFKKLQKFFCLDEINTFIHQYGMHKDVQFATDFIHFLNIRIQVNGTENIPESNGHYIFVANHPLGGPDGIALISVLGTYFPKLKFPVNDILLNIKNMDGIFLPVNKHGAQSREGAQAINKAYESDAQVIMFPAGLCSRRIKGQVADLEWKKNFVAEAVRHQRDVVPIHISGQNSRFFYRLANLRKRLGIKFNIEMLWLPKETMQKRNSLLTITFHKPIPWQTLDSLHSKKEWAAEIRKSIYE